jgi:aspartate/methionine/tyrosine aminotransferase
MSEYEKPEPSSRSQKIPPFLVMDVLEEAQRLEATGERVVHLEIGEPDFDTPEVVKQAAIEAIARGETCYTHSQGLIELREAIAAHYRERYSVTIDPDRIIVTSGTSPALFLALSAILEPGDDVVISDPSYSCYANMIEFCGGRVVRVPVFDEEGYQLDVERVRAALTPRTRALFINSPANPTGTTLSRQTLAALAELTAERGLALLSDEIYHGLVYEGDEVSALEVAPNAFVFNGFSKAYAMTGWRLGYVIAPDAFKRPLQKMQQNLFLWAANFVKRAGRRPRRPPPPAVASMRAEYDRRRRFLVPELRRLGFSIETMPQGAFYVFAGYRSLPGAHGLDPQTISSVEIAHLLLHEAGVAVAPGIDFGHQGEGYIRFSYAASLEELEEAVRRIERWLSERATG